MYLRFLSEKQVPVTVKLRDGEAVHGWIEYFDDRMIRLTRDGKPNLFIYKDQIRTITESFRNIEARRRERNRSGKEKTDAALAPAATPTAVAGASTRNGAAAEPRLTDGNVIDAPRPQAIEGNRTQGGS